MPMTPSPANLRAGKEWDLHGISLDGQRQQEAGYLEHGGYMEALGCDIQELVEEPPVRLLQRALLRCCQAQLHL